MEYQNKAATTIGFTGLLLGILINTISTLKLNEYNPLNIFVLTITLLLATFFLTMSAIIALAAHLKTKRKEVFLKVRCEIREPEKDIEKLLAHSHYWLAGGLASIIAAIPAIIFKTNPLALILTIIIFMLGIKIAYIYEMKSVYNN